MDFKKVRRDDCYSVQFIAEENGRKVGWGFLVIINNDRHAEPYGLLENVYVEPEFRGRGIGSRLVQEIIEEAKRIGCYKLLGQSRYGKEKVHDLYLTLGFKDHGKNFRMDLKESPIKQAD